jgi:cytochrome c553
MVYFTRFAPRFLVLFATFIFLLPYVEEAFSGPSVRHGLRQYRQHDMHHGTGHMGKGTCPQIRYTVSAPDEFLKLKNPLKPDSINLFAGESLFHTDAQPTACKICHGSTGNGMGMMAPGLNPPPRNFSCSETMKSILDGQMFWVVKNGSSGTGMVAYKSLSDKQIWQIILYLRTLTN